MIIVICILVSLLSLLYIIPFYTRKHIEVVDGCIIIRHFFSVNKFSVDDISRIENSDNEIFIKVKEIEYEINKRAIKEESINEVITYIKMFNTHVEVRDFNGDLKHLNNTPEILAI